MTSGQAVKYIFSKKYREEYKQKNAERLEKEKKEKEEKQHKEYTEKHEKKLQDWKDNYGISIERVNTEYDDPKKFYNDIVSDCKSWLTKILNSSTFKEKIENLLADEKELENIDHNAGSKPSLSYFKSIFKIKEGVNGWTETIQVCDGSQDECIYFNWIVYDLADMIDEKYDLGCSCGDGDEGHIYYDIYR